MNRHSYSSADYETDEQVLEMPDDEGRRIRWERHPTDSTLIIVLDALTGGVIAVVRSLFEIPLRRS